MDDPVLFDTRPCRHGMRLGLATLNAPDVLNSLSLDMCEALTVQLDAWEHDAKIAVVILQGAGGKAFCAGGNLRSLYHDMLQNARDQAHAAIGRFFEVEYRLDYRLHHYGKPLLVWGHGIVMGGGLGSMAGASHRVVSHATRLAMSEISIGLFPDVGASYFLPRAPGHSGLFMALTGAVLGAADACFAGLADLCIDAADSSNVLDALCETPWQHGAAARTHNDALLRRRLKAAATLPQPMPGPLQRHLSLINDVCARDALEDICAGIQALTSHADPWLARAAQTLAAGAPGSARLAHALQQRARDMTLAEVFRTEYQAALACAAQGDLQEGIRALLVDKDRQPRWHPATLAQADEVWLNRFFVAPRGSADHPLADLGA